VTAPADADTRTPALKPRPYYAAVGLLEKLTTLRRIRAAPAGEQTGVRILCYHRISRDRDVLAVSPELFRRHMDAVRASGARVLRLDAAIDVLCEPVGELCVCVTFDDGYRDALDEAAPILREFEIPGTVYLPTAMIDGDAPFDWYRTGEPPRALDWAGVAELVADGNVDVQSHTVTHPRLTVLDENAARRELELSKAEIERHVPAPVTSLSYPAGLYGRREARLAHETGYRAAVTCRPGLNQHGIDMAELRRNLIGPRDDLARFQAKLSGRLDAPSRLTEAMQRRRGRAASR
jgi:peptidoglycan/xylan/chitin deacetylase (PgdA/CDA1 family)